MNERQVIAHHRTAGTDFVAGGVQSFVRAQGTGESVVCLHGVPASSFLYRHVLAELDARRLRGVAFDLPGLGLAARPRDFDYSWTGLGEFAAVAVDALELDRFHLVVHDIGGPVGFEVASRMPERVASMTVLNTMVDVASFRPPWPMRPFARRRLGELFLRSMSRPVFRRLMRRQGVRRDSVISDAELDAYVGLLEREDGGRAFLEIMRRFETTEAKQALYRSTLADARYPVRVVWGGGDPGLRIDVHGEAVRRAAGVAVIDELPGRHFVQEDAAAEIADRVLESVRTADRRRDPGAGDAPRP